MRLGFASLLLAPVLVAACQPASTDNSAPQEGPVLSYTGAFVMAPIGGRDVTMGGVEVTVSGGDVKLTGATSDVATTVETHTMSMDDGKMRMRPVEGWEIRDGETLVLKRGGDHLMFFGVEDGLAAGDTANVTLYFDVDGREEPLMLETEAEVLTRGQ